MTTSETTQRTLTHDEIERITNATNEAARENRMVTALVETWHVLLGVDEITEPFSVTAYAIPRAQAEQLIGMIVEPLTGDGHMAANDMLTWVNKGPGSFEAPSCRSCGTVHHDLDPCAAEIELDGVTGEPLLDVDGVSWDHERAAYFAHNTGVGEGL